MKTGGAVHIFAMVNIEISDNNKILSNNDESDLNAKIVS